MTGLLAFNEGIQSRRTSTGTMGLPKSLTRTSSLNAQYDRMLGSTQSIRTGKGSTKILAEVGNQFRLSGEEKKEKVQRDYAEIYRKLGIKMPAKGSREMEGGVGVMERLERYRLGNIPPPRGNTPPVELDEKLRKILYPSPPPPAPLTPTPPPIHLYSEHYYPTGSRVGQRMQAVHPQTSQIDHRYQTQAPVQGYPPHPPALGGQVRGWVYTAANGWIYIPPPQSYPTPYDGYTAIPPPPPIAQGYPAHLAYPSPYSDVPSSSESHPSPLKYYRNEHPSHTLAPQQRENLHPLGQDGFDPREPQPYDRRAVHDTHPHVQEGYPSQGPPITNQYISPQQQSHSHLAESEYFDDSRDVPTYQSPARTQSYPKGILRDTSSDLSGHGRMVKFRETPDYAYPEQFRQEAEEVPEPVFCSPPQWKLRKINSIPRPVAQDDEDDPSQTGYYRQDENGDVMQDVRDLEISEDHTSPLRGRGQNNNEVPAMLASVHQQLLSGHGVSSGVSGKRSGRDLVRNLESLAEIQVARNEQPPCDSPAQNSLHHTPTTTRRQVSTEVNSPFPDHNGSERELPISASKARMGYRKEIYEETESHEDRQVPPLRFESDTPRRPRQDSDIRRPTPRSKDEIEVQRLSSTNIQVRTPSPVDAPRQAQSQYEPQYEPQTPRHPSQSRKVSTNGRAPPPSQNWRESQRPQMAFSQNESKTSQDLGSQISNRELSQARLSGSSGKKRGRQEWRDDEDGLDDELGVHRSQEEGNRSQEVGDQDQEVDQHSYSPNQDSHSNVNPSQTRSFETSGRQVNQETHQAHHSQERRISRSGVAPTSPPAPRRAHHRHRLTDLQIPLDDDPSDQSYRPSEADEEEELEYNYSQTRSISPEEPEPKRIKVTEGAWAKYDIPQDKLPVPPSTHVPFLQAYNKSRFSHHNKNKNRNQKQTKSRNEVNDENFKSSQSQSQSQISQIENSDDEMDNWMNEDIEESWSQILSDPPERDMKGGKALSTIAEEQEEEEEMGQVRNIGEIGDARWVEEGFFGDGGSRGFDIWRDRY